MQARELPQQRVAPWPDILHADFDKNTAVKGAAMVWRRRPETQLEPQGLEWPTSYDGPPAKRGLVPELTALATQVELTRKCADTRLGDLQRPYPEK